MDYFTLALCLFVNICNHRLCLSITFDLGVISSTLKTIRRKNFSRKTEIWFPLKTNLQCFQVRSFHANNISQKLVFKAVSCHSEIDQRTLSLHLRLVMRVGELCVQYQSERLVIFTLLVSDLNVPIEERGCVSQLKK